MDRPKRYRDRFSPLWHGPPACDANPIATTLPTLTHGANARTNNRSSHANTSMCWRMVASIEFRSVCGNGSAHVTWVAKQQRGFERGDLPGPQRRMKIFLSAIEQLLSAGYRAIGMDTVWILLRIDLAHVIKRTATDTDTTQCKMGAGRPTIS